MKNKVILSIDASSSAIGYSLMDKDKIYLSGTFSVLDPRSMTWDERVPDIINRFEVGIRSIELIKTAEELGCNDLLLNLGYVPANGVDTSTIALSDVQAYMRLKFVYSKLSWNYIPVLDQSWLNALAEFNNWTGSKNELKNRSTKKFETVKAALKLKGQRWETAKHEVGARYTYSKGVIPGYAQTCEVPQIMDDEADAIFAGWSFLNEKISDSTLVSRRIKKVRSQIEELESKVNKIKSRVETIDTHVLAKTREIKTYQEKEKLKSSVVNTKAISNREKEITQLENEKLDILTHKHFYESKIKELKDK